MGNKELGIADPVYDALRIRSGQSIAPDLGGGTTGAGGIENKIYVWHADGSTIDLFDPDEAGLALALTAAVSGDTVWLPSMAIALTAGVTVPAGVTVRGIAQSSILSFSGFSGTGITLNGGSVLNGLTVLYDGTGQASARGILASGTDWNIHLCNVYIHGATTNIGLQGAGTSTLFRGFVEFSHLHANGGTTDQAAIITAGGCVTLAYSTFLADGGATTNQALNNAANSFANEVIVEHCRFDSDQDGIYNTGYLVVFETVTAGTSQGLNNQAGATAQVFALRWSSLSNAGTVTYLDGDRGAWNTATSYNQHASDIADSTFTYHNNPSAPAATAGHVIKDEGTTRTQRANLNFVGAGVAATDDAGNNATVVTVNHPALDDLTDVNASSPAVNDVIAWNGSAWSQQNPNRLIDRAWGSMYQDDISTVIAIGATNTDYIVTGMSAGALGNMTFQNSKELVIVTDGVYQVVWSMSFTGAAANQEIEGAVGVGGVRQPNTAAHSKLGTGTDTIQIGGTGLLSLVAGNLVQITVRNETGTNNVTIEHANISLVFLGLTVGGQLLLETGDALLLETGDNLLLEG